MAEPHFIMVSTTVYCTGINVSIWVCWTCWHNFFRRFKHIKEALLRQLIDAAADLADFSVLLLRGALMSPIIALLPRAYA
jgi:hypothetical protein